MDEVPLPGGNTVGAVLIGDVVHKRASPWTPTVHALLRHLEDAGVDFRRQHPRSSGPVVAPQTLPDDFWTR